MGALALITISSAVAQLPPPITTVLTPSKQELAQQQLTKDLCEAFRKCGINVKPVEFFKWGAKSKGSSDNAANQINGDLVPAGKFWWVMYAGVGTDDSPVVIDWAMEIGTGSGVLLPHMVLPGRKSTPTSAMNGATKTFLWPNWYLHGRSNKLAAGNRINLVYFALEFDLCEFPKIAGLTSGCK